MPKAKAKPNPWARRPDESFLAHQSRLARERQEQRDRSQPLVTPEAQRHGDYRDDTLFEINEQGHPVRNAVKVNRGGTPVCRWIAQKRLTQGQQNAIRYVTRLWAMTGLRTALTANYGERIAGGGHGEGRSLAEIEAREDLKRVTAYVPRAYFDVFENVVRHGIAAGVAGAALNHASRDAKHTAYLTVCFVADVIAMKERL